jgi:hypothetical protein
MPLERVTLQPLTRPFVSTVKVTLTLPPMPALPSERG